MNKLENILKEMSLGFFAKGNHKISSKTLFESKNSVMLDVRSREENESLSFPLRYQTECIHIPIDEVPDRLSEIPKDKIIGIFCSTGIRAAIVYAFLRTSGFDKVRIMVGGYEQIVDDLKPAGIWKSLQ